LAQGDYAGAERLCLKALKIHSTAEGTALLRDIKTRSSTPQASTSSASTSSGTAKKRKESTPTPAPQAREYTPDQLAHVKRIRSHPPTAYYEILSITDKSCSEGEIKKAYRKHSLLLHPDKNGAPGSDEAFKCLSFSLNYSSC